MTGPDLPRLARRVDAHDDTLRAISDTLLDVREIVDGHTVRFEGVEGTLAEHGRTLSEHSRMLGEHTRLLGEQGRVLGEQGRTLDGHTVLLAALQEMVGEVLRRLERRP